MPTRVKICCISSLKEARQAIAAGADALGLVGEMPSGPGTLDDELIRMIAAAVPPPVATFLLTQRTEAESIAEHAQYCGVNTVQIVNHIDPAEYPRLTNHLPASIRRVQVIHVENDRALELIDAYSKYVDAFLLDSGRPSADIPELGGTGRVHDWRVSAEFVQRSPVPVFLAGGLHPGNIAVAIHQVRPYGVDLCSGVRTEDELDVDKLRDFMAGVGAIADHQLDQFEGRL